MVSVWASESRLVLGQEVTNEKSNETCAACTDERAALSAVPPFDYAQGKERSRRAVEALDHREFDIPA